MCICTCAKSLQSCLTVAHQTPLSVGFSGQEYWSGLPCPPPGDLPNPGVESAPHIAGRFSTAEPSEKPICFSDAYDGVLLGL